MENVAALDILSNHARHKFRRIDRRAAALRQRLTTEGKNLNEHEFETETSSLVINIQSYWSNWCRSFYVSSCLGATSATGVNISSGLGPLSEHQALTVAIKGTLTPAKAPPAVWSSAQEPKWFSPTDLSSALGKALITNEATISGFLISQDQVLSHLRTTRNYYAHRSEHLKADALSLGPSYLVGLPAKPSDILHFVEPGRSVSVLQRWIIALDQLAGAVCA